MIVAAMVATLTLAAQPAVTRGAESRRLDAEDLEKALYVGTLDNMDAWIMEGRRHVKQVVLTDLNMEPVSIAPIDGTGDMQVLAASVDGRRTSVLLLKKTNRSTAVLRGEIDADSRALVESFDTVVVYEYGRKDECMVWAATSPSGNYNALVCVVQLNETKQYGSRTFLLDARMRVVWDKEFAMGSMHEVMVTDSGRVVTLGVEREGEEAHFIFNTLDGRREASYDAVVKCDPVKEIHLANVVGRFAVAVGLYQPAQGRNADKLTEGVLTMSFDLDAAVLAGITMRPFQNEDMNIFQNMKTKKIQKSQVCDHIAVLGLTPTSWGAAMALGRDMEIEKSSNGGSVTREGLGVGVNVVAVDTTGHVRWVRNIRRNDVSKENGVPKVGLATSSDGHVCVVKTESPKAPEFYDISDEARKFTVGDKGSLVTYTIDADGKTERLLLERKTKQTLFRTLARRDGTVLIYSLRGNKTRLAELRF